jgi:hypothetical protein
MSKCIDLTGERFGRLTVLYRGENVDRSVVWVCVCDCSPDSKIHVRGAALSSGKTRSCGCLRSQAVRERGTDLTAREFGQWTVIRQAPNRGLRRYWLCKCSCGLEKEVAASNLCGGNSRSCRDCWLALKKSYHSSVNLTFPPTPRFLNKDDGAAEANQQAQTQFYSTLASNYNTDFGQFEGAMNNFNAKLDPIINAGPGQYGFDATQDAAIRGAAIDNDAAAGKNAAQATEQRITAANGGADLMPTGATEQLRQEGNMAAAQKTASDQNAITQAGYKAGQDDWKKALGYKEDALSLMNPNAFAGSATGAGNAATGAVNADVNAQQASTSWAGALGGALGSAAGGLLPGGAFTKLIK